MDFFRRLVNFSLIVIFISLCGYVLVNNLEFVNIDIPFLGAFKLRVATVFILAFLLGSIVTVFFLGFDSIRRSLIINRKDREIRLLKNQIAQLESKPNDAKEDILDKVQDKNLSSSV